MFWGERCQMTDFATHHLIIAVVRIGKGAYNRGPDPIWENQGRFLEKVMFGLEG